MKTWSFTRSGSGGGTVGVIAGGSEAVESEEEDKDDVRKVVGDGDNAVEGAVSGVICANDEAGRTRRKRSVEDNKGLELGHRHVVLGRLEIIVSL